MAGSSDAGERERLTSRIAALKASVTRHDESIAALTSSASTSEDGLSSHARATGDLPTVLKVQLAELHKVLLNKERAIQELRLKVCRRRRASGAGCAVAQM
jgi:predicted RNase H-like nuclease (RuvC/YqgF family)